MAPTPLGTHEHSRVHFSILRLRTRFRAATRKERPCFAAECGLARLGHTGTLEALEQPHEKNGPVLLQNVAPTPLGTHEHSRAHFTILRLGTLNQGVPKGLEQPHEKKGGHLEIGTWPRLKCTFYEQNLVLQKQPQFSRCPGSKAKFRTATRKERPCFAAECGLDRLGHTGTLEALEQAHEKNGPVLLQNVAPTPLGTHEHSRVHFSILRLRTQFRAATRKERPRFAAECGFGRLGHTGTLEALEQPQEKNGPVLLQNAAPTPLGTHEHSRVHFLPGFTGVRFRVRTYLEVI